MSRMDKSLKSKKKNLNFQHFSFYEGVKVHAQLSSLCQIKYDQKTEHGI